jgi:serine/threonine-protein kinase
MELLEGETLGQRLGRMGAIDPVELCQTLLPIIDGLHSAHGHGVIHRDLKPDNVFVAKTDGGGVQPKLLDFGIAKLRGESSFHSTKLTQAGTLIGSPDYMSPEQARGETDLDPRSDVWALCVLAYECLVGKPPFHGDNYNALLWAIIHDEPVPITVFQAGDSELWRVLKTGFAKDRSVRWESARKLGEALAAWLESRGVLEDICNRSLQASWLPAERPTRPELAPFDPHAPGLPHHRPAYGAVVPPTLAALRRPHAMSLWFAGLGLLTLLAALFLSRSSPDGIPTVDATHDGKNAGGRQTVGTLLPGPAPETREAGALEGATPTGAALPGAGLRAATLPSPSGAFEPVSPSRPGSARTAPPLPMADDPIGETELEQSSWKANHDRSSRALAQDVEDGLRGRSSVRNDDKTTASNTTGDRRRTSKTKAATDGSAKPKPARTAAKKPLDPKPAADTEVDFGI